MEDSRRRTILKHITRQQRGIEIGPWHSPLAPKGEGYDCLVLDLFDQQELRRRAEQDPLVPRDRIERIEAVDLVGPAGRIAALCEQRFPGESFDYVVSSNNFEHLPDPIRFLQDCSRLLKPSGVLSLCLPDRRACCDYFRSATRIGDWLEAYFEQRQAPTPRQIFDAGVDQVRYLHQQYALVAFERNLDRQRMALCSSPQQEFARWQRHHAQPSGEYVDVHCSVFTPASFELLVRDAELLGLSGMRVVEIELLPGFEFVAHLRPACGQPPIDPQAYASRMRHALLGQVLDD